MKTATILLAIVLGMVAGCCPKIVNQSSTTIRDSLVITSKTVYDTAIVLPDAVAFDWLSTDTVSNTKEEKNGRADLKVTNNHGKIIAECKCDSAAIVRKHLQKDSTHFIKTTTDKTGLKPIFVTSDFDKFCHWWFYITAVVIVGSIAIKYGKFLT